MKHQFLIDIRIGISPLTCATSVLVAVTSAPKNIFGKFKNSSVGKFVLSFDLISKPKKVFHKTKQNITSIDITITSLTTMDTIPEDIYQHIFSYLLEDNVDHIFSGFTTDKSYRLQFVNKTFQRSFQHYLKTNQLILCLEDIKKSLEYIDVLKKHDSKSTLQLMRFLKRYNVSLYHLYIEYEFDNDHITHNIMKIMHGINFSSLRELWLVRTGRQFDFEVFKDCNKLTCFYVDDDCVVDKISAQKLKTLLSLNKHNLESLFLPIDILPKDLRSWPSLQQLVIPPMPIRASKTIQSSTLQYLVIWCYSIPTTRLVIKCPNLEVLLIEIDNDPDHPLELKPRSHIQYFKDYNITCVGTVFGETCHPSELRKIGIEVEVSNDCDIGLRLIR